MKRAAVAVTAGIALATAIGVGVASAATGTGPGSWVSDTLSGLVKDGTITQKQADAVTEALTDSQEQARAQRQQQRQEDLEQLDSVLQDTLGMSAQELRTRLREGTSLKDIAGDKADELGAALVTLAKQRAADAVAAGRMTQEQADDVVARVQDRVKAWLAGDDDLARLGGLGLLLGERGMHGHGRGGPGMGRGWDSDDDAPTAPPAAPSGAAGSSST